MVSWTKRTSVWTMPNKHASMYWSSTPVVDSFFPVSCIQIAASLLLHVQRLKWCYHRDAEGALYKQQCLNPSLSLCLYVVFEPSGDHMRLTSSIKGVFIDWLQFPGISRFPVAAVRAWNSLPSQTRAGSSLLTFRWETKSHLFRESFGWWKTGAVSAWDVQHYLCFFVKCPRNCCPVMVSLKSLLSE